MLSNQLFDVRVSAHSRLDPFSIIFEVNVISIAIMDGAAVSLCFAAQSLTPTSVFGHELLDFLVILLAHHAKFALRQGSVGASHSTLASRTLFVWTDLLSMD